MSTSPAPGNLPPDLEAAVAAVNAKPGDLGAMFRLGGLLHDHGQHPQATQMRQHLTAIMVDALRSPSPPPPDTVANLLLAFYQNFVKKIETEQQARDCFQSWLVPVVEYGRRFRDTALPVQLWQPTAARAWRMGFFLHGADILGHTEALFELLEHRPRDLPWHDMPVVYVFAGVNPELTARLTALGAVCVNLQQEMPKQGFLARMEFLRRRMAEDHVSHFIWVSAPATAELAMAMRLAPVQVFWTLKFHPFQIPDIDGYITYGAWSEEARVVHGERWSVVPFMMSRPSPPVAEAEIAAARAPFAQHDILFGTLARTEKMNAAPFLDAVVRILREHPRAGFLWTGRELHAGIQAHFERGGVAAQCHFIGWVQTPLYARVLDIFLESFPFGCGLTGIQALEAGTPFLSYAASETQFGMHFMRPLAGNGAAAQEIRGLLQPADGSGPLLYAATADEYVALAAKLVRDADFRRKVGAAGQNYYRRYLTDSGRMARRFFDLLAEVKQPADDT